MTSSVSKLLSRIVTPDIRERNDADIDLDLHDYTFGITSDPLTHFSVIFSALIHDRTLIAKWNDLDEMRADSDSTFCHS